MCTLNEVTLYGFIGGLAGAIASPLARSVSRLVRRLCVPVLLMLISSCALFTEPDGMRGGYRLRSYDGRAVPTSYAAPEGVTAILESGIIVLRHDNTYIDVAVQRVTQHDGRVDVFHDTASGTWALVGDSLIFSMGSVRKAARFSGSRFSLRWLDRSATSREWLYSR